MRRDELTSVFDVIQGHWKTREVYLAGGRLNPSESLAVARHSPNGFGWGDGGSGAAQLALAILLRATDRGTAAAHYQAFKWDVIAKLPQADFSLRLYTPCAQAIEDDARQFEIEPTLIRRCLVCRTDIAQLRAGARTCGDVCRNVLSRLLRSQCHPVS